MHCMCAVLCSVCVCVWLFGLRRKIILNMLRMCAIIHLAYKGCFVSVGMLVEWRQPVSFDDHKKEEEEEEEN